MWKCHMICGNAICGHIDVHIIPPHVRRTSTHITSRAYQGRPGEASLSPHHVSPMLFYHRRYVVGREM